MERSFHSGATLLALVRAVEFDSGVTQAPDPGRALALEAIGRYDHNR